MVSLQVLRGGWCHATPAKLESCLRGSARVTRDRAVDHRGALLWAPPTQAARGAMPGHAYDAYTQHAYDGNPMAMASTVRPPRRAQLCPGIFTALILGTVAFLGLGIYVFRVL